MVVPKANGWSQKRLDIPRRSRARVESTCIDFCALPHHKCALRRHLGVVSGLALQIDSRGMSFLMWISGSGDIGWRMPTILTAECVTHGCDTQQGYNKSGFSVAMELATLLPFPCDQVAALRYAEVRRGMGWFRKFEMPAVCVRCSPVRANQ